MDYRRDKKGRDGIVFQPSTSPVLTGTLELHRTHGMEAIARRLLGLPNGLHFRKLMCTWCLEGDLRWMMALLVGCSDTLECVDISDSLIGTFLGFCAGTSHSLEPPFTPENPQTASIDFSEATKLREVVFRPKLLHIAWVIMAVQTITPKHKDLQRISIKFPHLRRPIATGVNVRQLIRKETYWQWMDLDRLLVQLWESRIVRPKIVYSAAKGKEEMVCEWIRDLLPEITERGIIDLVERCTP